MRVITVPGISSFHIVGTYLPEYLRYSIDSAINTL